MNAERRVARPVLRRLQALYALAEDLDPVAADRLPDPAHGVCPACGETIGLTPAGRIMSHTDHGRHCRGSQRYPEYEPERDASLPVSAAVSPAEPPEAENETQVFEYHVEGIEYHHRTYLPTGTRPFDEVYAIRAEHPAEGLEKLLHEVEWGILDSYAGFTITVAETEEAPDA